jgi:hypothetical protein
VGVVAEAEQEALNRTGTVAVANFVPAVLPAVRAVVRQKDGTITGPRPAARPTSLQTRGNWSEPSRVSDLSVGRSIKELDILKPRWWPRAVTHGKSPAQLDGIRMRAPMR